MSIIVMSHSQDFPPALLRYNFTRTAGRTRGWERMQPGTHISIIHCLSKHTQLHTHRHTHTGTPTNTHTHTNTRTRTYTHTHIHTHTHTHTHTEATPSG